MILKFIIIKLLNISDYKIMLYLLFGFIAEIIGTLFSIMIRIELAYPGIQVLGGDWQYFKGSTFDNFYKKNNENLDKVNYFVKEKIKNYKKKINVWD